MQAPCIVTIVFNVTNSSGRAEPLQCVFGTVSVAGAFRHLGVGETEKPNRDERVGVEPKKYTENKTIPFVHNISAYMLFMMTLPSGAQALRKSKYQHKLVISCFWFCKQLRTRNGRQPVSSNQLADNDNALVRGRS